MAIKPQILKIRCPDDWHVHLRNGRILKTILPYTSQTFRRAIIMPNLTVPITTVTAAENYRKQIIEAIPSGHIFTPLMTCYLTETLSVAELKQGFNKKVFYAAKLYLANVTTNSNHGVINITAIYPLFEQMQKLGMPLLIHGEVVDTAIDIFDREARFIDQILTPIRQCFSQLKIVFEHISTKEAVEYVLDADEFLAATITPQHLMFNRNHMLASRIHPHLFCLPILKRSHHQQALRAALSKGCNRFFLGTDSAPHIKEYKESAYGCAGIFNAPGALSIYTAIFEELNALKHLEAFCSENGANFYGLPKNEGFIELIRNSFIQVEKINVDQSSIIPFLAGQTINWSVKTKY
ncbi:dihydroorotase [Candidatus Fukatsuia anoeciicola]|uniref:dihydroorotase n=1 Tax=Candidatus Fukatsuia anoeciicola TaxID=2994492 RepID=UPI0034645DCB